MGGCEAGAVLLPYGRSGMGGAPYAATVPKNVSTSWRSFPAASPTEVEADSTVCADRRLSVAAPATSPSTETITLVPRAAALTLWEISLVAVLCSCTADETAV